VKTFEISRKRFDSGGQLVDESKCLTVNVKQGWKKGTKVTFPGEGDEGPDVLAADIVFVIQETNEMSYTREGNNLIYTHKISLSDALSDCSLQIPTLDRRLISLACPEVVSPYYEKLIPGTSHRLAFEQPPKVSPISDKIILILVPYYRRRHATVQETEHTGGFNN
jgi:DnaJ homolog subfamily B member 4